MLNQVYILHVRPQLDYGAILYHKYDPDMRQGVTYKLKIVQSSTVLAISGGWKGTNGQRILQGIGLRKTLSKEMASTSVSFFQLK